MSTALIDASWYKKPKHKIKERHSAGGIIMRLEGQNVYIALARHRGLEGFILPKGGIDKGENALEAARREIAEEAGFSELELLEDLGILERLSFDKKRWIYTQYYLFYTTQKDVLPTEPEQHDPCQWVKLSEIKALFWPEQEKLIKDNAALINAYAQKKIATSA